MRDFTCPTPLPAGDRVLLGHGSGGTPRAAFAADSSQSPHWCEG
ncbi:MAG: hypothetical protein U0Q16_32065 [Bryobacteraceae bacterium]